MNIKEGLTFNDVLLVPQYSSLVTRKEVNLSVDLGKGIRLRIPIVSANMSDVTEWEMAYEMVFHGGLGIIHRFNTINEQVNQLLKAQYVYDRDIMNWGYIGCAVGIKEEDKKRVKELVKNRCRVICVDVAHAHHEKTGEFVKWVSTNFPDVLLIAGNVSTSSGAHFLADCGVDVIKCGQGNGSICLTRIETGNGVPQLTALDDVCKSKDFMSDKDLVDNKIQRKFKVIADGGLSTVGNCVKALCFADAVMLGNMLAGTKEAPGEKIEIDGKFYKTYDGSSTHRINHVEGVKAHVPYKGHVASVISHIKDGLRSGLSYQGCRNLQELKENPQFVKVTNAGQVESNAHDVVRE